MSTLTERLAIVITGESIGGQTAFKQVGAASAEAAQQMSVLERASGAVTSTLGGATPYVVGFAAGLAALKVADHLVNTFSDVTANVRAFQRISGASAEDSSRLVAAFNVLGVDSDKAGTALFRLAHNLDGNSQKLSGYGVAVATASNGSVDLTNTLLNVADAVEKVGPGAEADAIAFAAFGRQATALLPVLLRGRDGLQELFDAAGRHQQIFSAQDLEDGRKFKVATAELGEAFKGLEIEGGKALIPFATNLVKQGDAVLSFVDKVAGGLDSIFGGHHAVAQQDLAASAQDAAQQMQNEADSAAEVAKALTALDKATTSAATATRSHDDAVRSATAAGRDEASAQRDLDKLLKDTAVDAEKVAAAKTRSEDASRSLTRAQREEGDAAKAVADAVTAQAEAQKALEKIKEGADPKDIARAELSVAAAKRDQQRAVLGIADAEAKAASIKTIGVLGAGDVVGTAQDQEKAQLDLSDAQDQVKRSALDASDAQAELTRLQNLGKPGSDELKKAQDDLAAKTDAVEQATQRQSDAHDAVTKAQEDELAARQALADAEKGDPDYDQKLADARQKVADAHDNTARAKADEATATDTLAAAEADLYAQQRQRQADMDARAAAYQSQVDAANAANRGGRGGTAGPGTGPAATGSQPTMTHPSNLPGAPQGYGEQAWQAQLNYITINTGADPAAVQRALDQWAARNGGSPRK